MKKQLLTLALLATVAVGGAFAGNSAIIPEQGFPFNASGPCTQSLRECSSMIDAPCTFEISPNEFIQLYDNTTPAPGTCTISMYDPEL